jgi:hypothetical protein
MSPPNDPAPVFCAPAGQRREAIRLGAGFRLRRILILVGWLILPVLLITGARSHSPVHILSAIILGAALWPVTTRSGEVLWDGSGISVRRYLRFIPLDRDRVEAAVVTPPMFRRQSLVLRLRRPLHLSRYVYCRLAPGTVCDAWALVHENDWEPRT